MIFDDGSTIDYSDGMVTSTPSPAGWALSDYGDNTTPGAVSPGATSWTQVLQQGFGRAIDYATAKNTPQNTPATYATGPTGGTNQQVQQPGFMGISSRTLLLGGLVIAGLMVAAAMAKKD